MLGLSRPSDEVEATLDAARVGVWSLDLRTMVMVCSRAYKANYGRAPNEPFSYEDLAKAVHVDDLERWRAAVDAAIASGNLEVEYRAVWPNGDVRWVYVNATVQRDTNGQAVTMHGVSLDIDARKRSEERLSLLDAISQATRVLSDPLAVMATTARLVAEHLGVTRCAYADVDNDNDTFTIRADWTEPGVPSSAGRYSLNAFGPEAALALRAGQTLTVDDSELLVNGPGAFASIGIRGIICCPLVKGDRLVAMMAVHSATPRRWQSSEIALLQHVVERCRADIERVGANVRLREEDQRKDEFLATLAHELRNPLAPLRTGLYVIAHERLSAGADKARLAMQRQVDHMVRLVDDLLDVSRIRRGTIELRREPVSLQALISHAVETSSPHAAAAGHELSIVSTEEPLWVNGDAVRIAQVITNILNNAFKYTASGGHIRLVARREGVDAVVEIMDDGVGIAPEFLTTIFELFARVNTHVGAGGLGIGLSLARRLVEMHGGSLTATSAGLGAGSCFVLRLPLVQPGKPTRHDTAHAFKAGSSSSRVLVVDDNIDGAEMLAAVLTRRGHDVRVTHDGPSALAVVKEFAPDVIFLDIGLPGLTGYEVARTLRDGGSHALLVALTGWGGSQTEAKSRDAGFDLHIAKPISAERLDATLATVRRG